MYCCHSHSMFCSRFGKTYSQTSLIGCNSISFHFYIWTLPLKLNFYGKNNYNYLYLLAIQGTFLLLSFNRWSNLSVPKANQRGEIIRRQRKNGVVTCVAKGFANYSMAPLKSQAQSSFDKSVLLSNPHSKMVGFCFGLAMPTLVWYTTLDVGMSKTKGSIFV